MIKSFVKRVILLFVILAGLFGFILLSNVLISWLYDTFYSERMIADLMMRVTRYTGSSSIAVIAIVAIDMLCKSVMIAFIYPFAKGFVMNNLELLGIEETA